MLELVIVIVIIGVIAAIAIPRMSSASQHSKFASTRATFTTFQKAMLLYQATYAAYPAAIPAGSPPAAVCDFISEPDWRTPAPLGGKWVWINTGLGLTGIGIASPTADAATLTAFDQRFDDGSLTSGTFQLVGTSYVMILDAGTRAGQSSSNQSAQGTGD